jgi:hypothetical protein
MLKYLFILISIVSTTAFADEQVAVSVSTQAIEKVSTDILSRFRKFRFRIDENDFILKNKDIRNNEFMNAVDEVLDVHLDKDIKINFEASSIRTYFNYGENPVSARFYKHGDKTRLKLKLKIDDFYVATKKFNFCEKYSHRNHACLPGDDQVFLHLRDVGIAKGRGTGPLRIDATAEVNVKNDKLYLKLISFKSNLLDVGAEIDPKIQFDIPRPKLIIDGEVYDLDVAYLKEEILAKSDDLAKLIVQGTNLYVVNGIVKDLNSVLMDHVNGFSLNQKILNYYSEEKDPFTKEKMDKYIKEAQYGYITKQDNTRHVRPIVKYDPYNQKNYKPGKKLEGMDLVMANLMRSIYHAEVNVNYENMYVPQNNRLVVGVGADVTINTIPMRKSNRYLYGMRWFKGVNEDDYVGDDYDMSVAISEPIINSVLNTWHSEHFINEIFEEELDVKGLSVEDIKVHFVSKTNYKNYVCKKGNYVCQSKAHSRIRLVLKLNVDTEKIRTNKKWVNILSGTLGYLTPDLTIPIDLEIKPTLTYNKVKNNYNLVFKLVRSSLLENMEANAQSMQFSAIYPGIYPFVARPGMKLITRLISHVKRKIYNSDFTEIKVDLSTLLETKFLSVTPKRLRLTDSGFMKIDVNVDCVNIDSFIEALKKE